MYLFNSVRSMWSSADLFIRHIVVVSSARLCPYYLCALGAVYYKCLHLLLSYVLLHVVFIQPPSPTHTHTHGKKLYYHSMWHTTDPIQSINLTQTNHHLLCLLCFLRFVQQWYGVDCDAESVIRRISALGWRSISASVSARSRLVGNATYSGNQVQSAGPP